MIILRLSGGLGNQMFQYAFGNATANRLGVDLALDLTDPTLSIHQGFELNRVFGIDVRTVTESELQAVLGWLRPELIRRILRKAGVASIFQTRWIDEPHFHFSPRMLEVPDGIYISGYWQSEKYFEPVAGVIRDAFKFREPSSELNRELVREISDNCVHSVSLHIRRGDYVHNRAVSEVYGSFSMAYYRAAMRHIVECVQDPFFYVFSDDMDWVRTHLEMPFPHKLIAHNRGESSFEDMRLMSLCRHHIIANSSFSWWGAWLNSAPDKIVVAPENWFSDGKHTHDLFPLGWVIV